MKWNKRGRPRREIVSIDFGTPELQLKRSYNLTKEAIDLYLEKDIISPEQHWCCIHFRWLHTLRYGTGSLSSSIIAHANAYARNDTLEWRQEREKEYMEAIHHLKKEGLHTIILDFIVYNHIPHPTRRIKLGIKSYATEFEATIHGLCTLQALWHK